MREVLPVSVVVPTIGRPRLLRRCLESLASCRPSPAEVLVVDQSGDAAVSAVAAMFAQLRVRVVPCDGRGRGRAVNRGLRDAQADVVLVTDDDCIVDSSWIAVAGRQWAAGADRVIVTGRVLPAGDPRAVPSTIVDKRPREFTHPTDCGMLYAGNMACCASAVLALGGFDERVRPAVEDVELCYRWLRDGGRLRYDPSLIVWHRAWRSPEQLERLYVAYARGAGMFYAKHLRQRDPTMLRFLARDLYGGFRGIAARRLRGRPRWSDPRQGVVRGLPAGFVEGWRTFRKPA